MECVASARDVIRTYIRFYITLYNKNYLVVAISLHIAVWLVKLTQLISHHIGEHLIARVVSQFIAMFLPDSAQLVGDNCMFCSFSRAQSRASLLEYFDSAVIVFPPALTTRDFIASSFRKPWLLLLFFVRNDHVARFQAYHRRKQRLSCREFDCEILN